MDEPPRVGDHYVLRKLANELLPWMVGGQSLGKQWFVRLAFVYEIAGDLAAALAGLGIGTPVVAAIQGKTQTGETIVDALRSNLPSGWFAWGVIGLALWLIIRLVVQQQNVAARALLAREYARSFKGFYAELLQALAQSEPMPQILAIQKSINDRVQEAIKNDVWPFDPPLPNTQDVKRDVLLTTDDFRTQFMHNWRSGPPAE